MVSPAFTAFAPQWLVPLAEVLRDLGSETVWVVHGEGLDEITTTGTTRIAELSDGKIREYSLTPKDFGVEAATLDALRGGDGKVNAAALRKVLSGERNAYRDIALCNAAAALMIAGKGETLSDAMAIAAQSLESGNAALALDRLVAVSNQKSEG